MLLFYWEVEGESVWKAFGWKVTTVEGTNLRLLVHDQWFWPLGNAAGTLEGRRLIWTLLHCYRVSNNPTHRSMSAPVKTTIITWWHVDVEKLLRPMYSFIRCIELKRKFGFSLSNMLYYLHDWLTNASIWQIISYKLEKFPLNKEKVTAQG